MASPDDQELRTQIHGPWQIVRRNEIYQDAWVQIRMDDVLRPDGKPGTYYLTKEFHYAVGRDTIEGISGGIEVGESAEIAASRELQEEVGIVAQHLHPLGIVDPLTAALCSPTAIFLATDLSFTETNMEGTERIERVAMPFEDAVRMVIRSEITHGPSCVAILKANLMLPNLLSP